VEFVVDKCVLYSRQGN